MGYPGRILANPGAYAPAPPLQNDFLLDALSTCDTLCKRIAAMP